MVVLFDGPNARTVFLAITHRSLPNGGLSGFTVEMTALGGRAAPEDRT